MTPATRTLDEIIKAGDGLTLSEVVTAIEAEIPAHRVFPLHRTYGVYPNGSWRRNAVRDSDLTAHVEYNKTMRFGRALFVDGALVYPGSCSPEVLQQFAESLPARDADWHPTQPTIPYQ